MSDQEDQPEVSRLSAIKENAVFFIGAVIVFNIVLVIAWVVYIFKRYDDFTRFHITYQQFTRFDDWMKYSIPWDIGFAIVFNLIFIGYLSEWLKRFRSKKEEE